MKKLGIGICLSIGSIIGLFLYNNHLNASIQVVKETVAIDGLSESFEGFKILQITDLHGIYFGENQEYLIEMIDQLDYDLLALTGDLGDLMIDPHGEAMKIFINGIQKKAPIVYVEGNHGPFLVDGSTGEKSNIAYWLEAQGVHLLEEPLLIERNNQKLWVAQQTEPFAKNEHLEGLDRDDILIGIMHYPLDENFYLSRKDSEEFPPYDLILAGHYHGGQWRIPFYGAIFVSDIYGNGWFPAQDRVSGLNNYSGYYQYISRGLGASGKNKLLRTRWFNPPEINLITLTNGE